MLTTREETTDPPGDFDQRTAFVYEMVHLRHLEQEAMLWDAPALTLAAQAFLFTIALGSDTSDAARLVSSGLGFVISLLAMQLMAKHRFLAEMDRYRLLQLERELGINPGIANYGWAWDLTDPANPKYLLQRPAYTRPRAWSSYQVWQVGIGAIGAVQVAIAIVALVQLIA